MVFEHRDCEHNVRVRRVFVHEDRAEGHSAGYEQPKDGVVRIVGCLGLIFQINSGMSFFFVRVFVR